MNKPENVSPEAQIAADNRKNSGYQWLAIACVFLLLTVGLAWVRTDLNTSQRDGMIQDQTISNLSKDSQRLREALIRSGVDPDNSVLPSTKRDCRSEIVLTKFVITCTIP